MGATRFKATKGSELRHAVWPNCKRAIDTWKHCVECYCLQSGEAQDEQQWPNNIRSMLEKAKTLTPTKYEASEKKFGTLGDTEPP